MLKTRLPQGFPTATPTVSEAKVQAIAVPIEPLQRPWPLPPEPSEPAAEEKQAPRFYVAEKRPGMGQSSDIWAWAAGHPGAVSSVQVTAEDVERVEEAEGLAWLQEEYHQQPLFADDLDDAWMWRQRAMQLLHNVRVALVHQSEQPAVTLQSLREHLDLDAIEALAETDLPAHVKAPLRQYLDGLPDYATQVPTEQGLGHSETTREQHGYLQMHMVHSLTVAMDRAEYQGQAFSTQPLPISPAMEPTVDREALGRQLIDQLKAALREDAAHRLPNDRPPTESPSEH